MTFCNQPIFYGLVAGWRHSVRLDKDKRHVFWWAWLGEIPSGKAEAANAYRVVGGQIGIAAGAQYPPHLVRE